VEHLEHEELTKTIIGCAMTVHNVLGSGFLESVYQNAIAHELSKSNIYVQCEKMIEVHYDSIIAGVFTVDMLVENSVIVENKAVQKLITKHEVQLVNYLVATGIETGLLLNFGADRLEFRRKYRNYKPRS
jgi:GxxExxY protein